MRILILGGSWSLGRLIAGGCAQRGMDVTVFNGGRKSGSRIDGVHVIRGDRRADQDMRDLARSGHWDVVVDIGGKVPAVVRRSARVLAGAADRYVSVSTNLVYRDWPYAPVDEDSPLRDGDPDFDPGGWTWDPELYGRMKAGCEVACREAFGDDRVLILRLHEIIGQHEDDGALLWWLNRMRHGGEVLVPAPDRPIQPIDVRDVASFTVGLVAVRAAGVVNVAAPLENRTYGGMVRACADVVSADAVAASELVWTDEDWLAGRGVRQWTELPLWRNAPAPWNTSVDRALALGLRCRPLIDTVAATWQWLMSGDCKIDHPRFTAYGMDPAREARLIAEWRSLAR
jgi:2'-hydroxyisoflavone reductase